MRGIHKAFGAVQALRDVDLRLYPGEILGLVGDNSAGKSTLMKIMTGAYQRDAGEILVDGQPMHFKSPHESRDVGIEMIYQDFALCGNMDVGQNIFLGRWPRKGCSSTARLRFWSLSSPLFVRSLAGLIYIAFYRSFIPTAGQFRELDAIASVIIGGGSIFGGFGTIIGSLAGAAVITLLRGLLSLQVIRPTALFVLSQHWVNVFIGLILIVAVISESGSARRACGGDLKRPFAQSPGRGARA